MSDEPRTAGEAARARAELLYEGVRVPHRSCGIALAETFGLPTQSYQALRKGGLTGEGPCGAIAAGMLVLGELLGDPDPTGAPTDTLRTAAARYRAGLQTRVEGALDTPCNARTAPCGAFDGAARKAMCTALAGAVAETVATTLEEVGAPRALPPAPLETPR